MLAQLQFNVVKFERNEIDPDRMDTSGMVTVEIPAGSAIFFGPRLVHTSGANHSAFDRRAMLYTYQAPGQRDMCQVNREWYHSENPT